MTEDPGFTTQSIHGNNECREGPVSTPIHPSSTYRFKTIEDLSRANAGKFRPDEFYLRYGNRNLRSLEEKLAALEGAESALAFSSGMAAISAVAFAFLRPGARLVSQRDIYGGTLGFFRDMLAPWGVEVVYVSMDDVAGFERACANGVDLMYLETPTNPLCRIVDLRSISAIARARGAPVACDATFASPYNQKTHALGCDLVIQSATKYLGGHSDLLGGTVAGTRANIERVERIRRRTGAVPDPEQAWRLERSLKTLALRVHKHNENALAVAEFLSRSRAIEKVHYPGLPAHPDHALARSQMLGFGGVLTFDVRGGEPAARRFAEALQMISIAPSLGGVESLISPPMHTSHASLPPDERRRAGISDGALRLSVGAEDLNDLIVDLERGLRAVE